MRRQFLVANCLRRPGEPEGAGQDRRAAPPTAPGAASGTTCPPTPRWTTRPEASWPWANGSSPRDCGTKMTPASAYRPGPAGTRTTTSSSTGATGPTGPNTTPYARCTTPSGACGTGTTSRSRTGAPRVGPQPGHSRMQAARGKPRTPRGAQAPSRAFSGEFSIDCMTGRPDAQHWLDAFRPTGKSTSKLQPTRENRNRKMSNTTEKQGMNKRVKIGNMEIDNITDTIRVVIGDGETRTEFLIACTTCGRENWSTMEEKNGTDPSGVVLHPDNRGRPDHILPQPLPGRPGDSPGGPGENRHHRPGKPSGNARTYPG